MKSPKTKSVQGGAAVRVQRHCSALSRYPEIKLAMEEDGAVRLVDGRHSLGFVNMDDLSECIAHGLLTVEERAGMKFAVMPNEKREQQP